MPDSLRLHRTTPGRRALIAVDRAIAELRRGSPVIVGDGAAVAVVLAPRRPSGSSLGRLLVLCGGVRLSGADRPARQRARPAAPAEAAGSGAIAMLGINAASEADRLRQLADPIADSGSSRFPSLPACRRRCEVAAYAPAAIDLAKLARLLPAVVLGMLPATRAGEIARSEDILTVSVGDIAGYESIAARSLRAVGEARVPLAGAEKHAHHRLPARRWRHRASRHHHRRAGAGRAGADAPAFRMFHRRSAGQPALRLRRPAAGRHRRDRAHGSGVLLYLAQEGRGIGLVNKLRAYRAAGSRRRHGGGQPAARIRCRRADLSAGRRDAAAVGLSRRAADDQQSGKGCGAGALRHRSRSNACRISFPPMATTSAISKPRRRASAICSESGLPGTTHGFDRQCEGLGVVGRQADRCVIGPAGPAATSARATARRRSGALPSAVCLSARPAASAPSRACMPARYRRPMAGATIPPIRSITARCGCLIVRTHERLWRDDEVYDLIVVLGHNDDPVIPGAGSAVFLHVARPDFQPHLRLHRAVPRGSSGAAGRLGSG